ncbi:MAG: alpha/beta hydrolase [Saprospirales bacterium]|nr:alpha/beta hydrolase [Saprospirales bacterium]MBK8492116.1 alpha/beta hydrolase [Saprospirales bacterium]
MTAFHPHPEGFQLFFRHWEVSTPKAVVVLAHGMGEHTGRYAHLASFFQSQSIAVIGADFPGFGQSSGKRGHAPGIETYFRTIDLMLEEATTQYPEIPVFLMGQSMGSNLVLNYVLERKPAVAGVLAMSPWIRIRKMPPAAVMTLARLMRRVFPAFSQSNGLDPTDFSRDPEVVEAYRKDPYTHDRVSAGIGFSLLEAGLFLDQYEGTFPCPLLLTHGTKDALTDPLATESFAGRLNGPVTLKLWEGLFHETYHEPEKQQVLEFLVNWIDHHAK